MSTLVTPAELRRMSQEDLRRDVSEHKKLVAKMALTVHLGKEKDTALFRREKKQLARMLTILTEMQSQTLSAGILPAGKGVRPASPSAGLKESQKAPTMPASSPRKTLRRKLSS